ncbi:uncharacterized protein [Apostichopus japonicus]|uniref:uncharacterized protein n=1 Tax=Stichopus japonicus TaxID=307972 RepID=UPI003AB4C476
MAIVAAATVTLSALASGKVVYDAANDLYKGQGGKFNLTLGLRKDGDVLLHEESISPGSGPGYQTREFKYRCRRNEVITYVVAEDKRGDGTGGSPELISGGAGQDHIIIEVVLCR